MPQPVDLNTELGRINTAERLQQLTDRASLAALQRAAAHAVENQVDLETQVQETSQSESEQVDAEARRRNPFVRRRRRKDGQESDQPEPPSPEAARVDPDSGEGHRLDVTV
jgi:hypothetical protein